MAIDDQPPEDGLVHDEVEIEDFEYDPQTETFTYPCPCGDEFTVARVSKLFDWHYLLVHLMTIETNYRAISSGGSREWSQVCKMSLVFAHGSSDIQPR